jgi:hypothetical protein
MRWLRIPCTHPTPHPHASWGSEQPASRPKVAAHTTHPPNTTPACQLVQRAAGIYRTHPTAYPHASWGSEQLASRPKVAAHTPHPSPSTTPACNTQLHHNGPRCMAAWLRIHRTMRLDHIRDTGDTQGMGPGHVTCTLAVSSYVWVQPNHTRTVPRPSHLKNLERQACGYSCVQCLSHSCSGNKRRSQISQLGKTLSLYEFIIDIGVEYI